MIFRKEKKGGMVKTINEPTKTADNCSGICGAINSNPEWVNEIKKTNSPPVIHQYEAVADLQVKSISYNPMNSQSVLGVKYIYLEWDDGQIDKADDLFLPMTREVAIMVIDKDGITKLTYFAENNGICKIPVKGICGENYIRILAIR